MNDHLDRLEKLTNLYERGALTEIEFQEHKTRLLEESRYAAKPSEINAKRALGGRYVTLGLVSGGSLILLALFISGIFGRNTAKPPMSLAESAASSKDDFVSATSVLGSLEDCKPSTELETLLESIDRSGRENEPNALATLNAFGGSQVAVTKVLERDSKKVRVSAADLSADWSGLKLRRIIVIRWEDGVGDGFRLVFNDSPEKVFSLLNGQKLSPESLGQLTKRDRGFTIIAGSPEGASISCYPRSDVAVLAT